MKGLRWRVGNGSNIHVFNDPWILRPSYFRPVTTSSISDLRVSDLIDDERHCWNVSKLDSIFLPLDTEFILSIPISVKGRTDCFSWHYDKRGLFTVKSGCWLALSTSLTESPSS